MEKQALICPVILNYNSYEDTVELCRQLLDITYASIKIIIVDNQSPDNSGNKLKHIESRKVEVILNQSNAGYAGGNNVGIKVAMAQGAEFAWILNPDIRIKKDTLSILAESITGDPKIAVLGPRICHRTNEQLIYSDGGEVDRQRGYQTKHLHSHQMVYELNTSMHEADYVDGSSMLIRIQALQELGMFYEGFFLYYEETEWCLRAKKAGWKVMVNTDAQVFHTASTKGEIYHFYMARNRIWLAKLRNEAVWPAIGGELSAIFKLFKYTGSLFFQSSKGLINRILGLLKGIFTSP